MNFIGQEEAEKLGYTILHHTNDDKTLCCYINKDGVSLTVIQKDYDKPGKLTARISALHGLTEIRSPEIAFPHLRFNMFENEVYICFPHPTLHNRVTITKDQFYRKFKKAYKSKDLIDSIREILFGKKESNGKRRSSISGLQANN